MKQMLVVSLALITTGFAPVGSRPVPPDTRSFVFVKDNKSAGGETFTRTRNSISGDIVLGKDRVHYEGPIAADGTIPRLDIRTSLAGGGTPRFFSVIVGHDGVRIIRRGGRTEDTLRLASPPGTMPLFDPSMGLYELIVERARGQKSRTVIVPIVKIDADQLDSTASAPLRALFGSGPAEVTFASGDTVMLGHGREKDKVRVFLGADGRARGAASGADAKDRFAIRPTSKPVSGQ